MRRILWLGLLFAFPVLMCGILTLGYLLIPPSAMNILVVGIDSRGNEGAVARTDSIMVVNVNADKVSLSVLSIPRGLWVNVPNYGLQMINTANFLGEANLSGSGMQLLSRAIEQNFNIPIDHYVRMDFAGFVDLVDAVGGVEIDVPRVIEDYAYPTADYGTIQIRFEQGVQWMDGERALMYARTRHSDDDYARAKRQQQVLSGFVSRALNPLTWFNIVSVLNQTVETDLNVFELASTAPTALLNGGRYNQLVINRDYIIPGVNGPVPDYAKLEPFLSANFR